MGCSVQCVDNEARCKSRPADFLFAFVAFSVSGGRAAGARCFSVASLTCCSGTLKLFFWIYLVKEDAGTCGYRVLMAQVHCSSAKTMNSSPPPKHPERM